jgi:diguanylate cyclase (GGDEF)-like protein/PAS domain S-box-containing protein
MSPKKNDPRLPRARQRLWRLLGFLPILVLPVAAAWTVQHFNQYADTRRVTTADVEALGNDANQATSAILYAIAAHQSEAAVAPTLQQLWVDLDGDIAALATRDVGYSRLADVALSASAFVATLHATLAHLDQGITLASGDPGVQAENAQYAQLIALIADAGTALTASADQAAVISQVSIWVSIIAASGVLVIVFWRGERRRRRDAVGRAHRETLEERARTFTLMFEKNPLPMWVIDPQTLAFLSVNDAAVAAYRYSREQLATMTFADLTEANPAGDAGNAVLAGPYPVAGIGRLRVADGRTVDVEMVVDEIETRGRLVRLVVARDVTEQRRLEDELRRRAFHDALTGLANRALFADRFQHAQAMRARDDRGLAVITLDLDGFKAINDTLGHHVGDEVIREVGRRLQSGTRSEDTVARMGGDEFAVVVENAGVDMAVQLTERLLATVNGPFESAGGTVEIRASAGVAPVASTQTAWDAALQQADIAMYVAKANGKGGYHIYEPGMRSQVLERLEVSAELRRAMRNGDITVHYQPIVATSGAPRVDHVEALVRWQHPTRGPVSPMSFIPIAEETGAIIELGAWILGSACEQVARWHAQGHDLTVNVNVSGRQLREPGFVAMVADVLKRTSVAADHLILELTETAVVQDMAAARRTLSELRDMGVRVALDDFGAGYSSLAYLRELPLDVVKIDRAFVASLDDAPRRVMVETIVRLLETLHVGIVAEGVETAEQLELVRGLGIDQYQGYYFSRPVPAADLPLAQPRDEAVSPQRHEIGPPRRLRLPSAATVARHTG